jgi:hypothetical protein
MDPGDLVEIYYGDGHFEQGAIVAVDQHTVTTHVTSRPNAGVIVVPVGRLKGVAPGRWRLSFRAF